MAILKIAEKLCLYLLTQRQFTASIERRCEMLGTQNDGGQRSGEIQTGLLNPENSIAVSVRHRAQNAGRMKDRMMMGSQEGRNTFEVKRKKAAPGGASTVAGIDVERSIKRPKEILCESLCFRQIMVQPIINPDRENQRGLRDATKGAPDHFAALDELKAARFHVFSAHLLCLKSGLPLKTVFLPEF
ncbi:MAG: hypothetical protein ABF308_09865 [Phaeobacter gallaeciensis]